MTATAGCRHKAARQDAWNTLPSLTTITTQEATMATRKTITACRADDNSRLNAAIDGKLGAT
jgi:hypothetical protein